MGDFAAVGQVCCMHALSAAVVRHMLTLVYYVRHLPTARFHLASIKNQVEQFSHFVRCVDVVQACEDYTEPVAKAQIDQVLAFSLEKAF